MEKETIFDDFMDAEVRLLRQLDALVGHESVAVGGGPEQYELGKTQQLPGQQEQQNQDHQEQGHEEDHEQDQDHGQEQEQGQQESVDMKPPVESAGVQS